MQKVILMASLVLFGVSLEGAQKPKSKPHDRLSDLFGDGGNQQVGDQSQSSRFGRQPGQDYMQVRQWQQDVEKNLELQTVSLDIFNTVLSQARVQPYGVKGSKVDRGSLSILFQPKTNDKEAMSMLKDGANKLFTSIPANTIDFSDSGVNIADGIIAQQVDLSVPINSIPHHVKFKDEKGNLVQISGAAYVCSLLYKITTDNFVDAGKILSILKGEKAAQLMFSLKRFMSQKRYNSMVNTKIDFLSGAQVLAGDLLAKAERQFGKIQIMAQDIAQQLNKEGAMAAKNFMQTFNQNRLYSLVCMGFGGTLAYFLMWWRNR